MRVIIEEVIIGAIAALFVIGLSGCASYRLEIGNPPDIVLSVRQPIWMRKDLDMVTIHTATNTATLGRMSQRGDAEAIQATGKATGAAIGAMAKKAVK